MPVQCTKCGEPLLGAVNRCWKCGSEFTPHHGEPDVPRVRRSPIDLRLVVANFKGSPVLAQGANGNATSQTVHVANEAYQGSGFAELAVKTLPPFSPAAAPAANVKPAPTRTQYPQHAASTGGAVGGIVLGILGVIYIFVSPIGALATSIMGIGLGLWGLFSNQRRIAMVGLVLCILIFSIAGFLIVVAIFEAINGYSPFEQILPEVEEGTLPASGNGNGLGLFQSLNEEQRWHVFG